MLAAPSGYQPPSIHCLRVRMICIILPPLSRRLLSPLLLMPAVLNLCKLLHVWRRVCQQIFRVSSYQYKCYYKTKGCRIIVWFLFCSNFSYWFVFIFYCILLYFVSWCNLTPLAILPPTPPLPLPSNPQPSPATLYIESLTDSNIYIFVFHFGIVFFYVKE